MSNLGGSNKLLTPGEVADRLSISKDTLYRNAKAWGLRVHRIGNQLRYRERDVEQFIERQAQ